MGSILYAKEVPERGGDTLFANQYRAYETLSPGMRRMLEGLRAVHTARHIYGLAGRTTDTYNKGQNAMAILPSAQAHGEVDHPVVRTHPETGRKCLYVNPAFTVRFKDMAEEESVPLLRFLYDHCRREEFTCRFQWKANSVAFWDNRCVQHFALNDYNGQRRIMHRVTVNGSRPV